MKLIHLSDLHIGRRLNEFSLLEDQEYILTKILRIIDDEQPDAVMIAGDIYDKSIPSAEAVQLFDRFLTRLFKRDLEIFIISGNHDSAERIAFGAKLLECNKVHISPVYDGEIRPFALSDTHGSVFIYLLPFLKPIHVRRFCDEAIDSYTDALQAVIKRMNVDESQRNVVIAHQFVTGADTCESEEVSVGGLDQVDASVFAPFDYVALGHIHGPQHVSRETIRYCGTPLKYSLSEKDHEKSVTVVQLEEKGSVLIRTVALQPLHDMRLLRGSYDELTFRGNYEGTDTQAYIQVVLTDEEEIPDVMTRLRLIYPNLMGIDYDNTRTKHSTQIHAAQDLKRKSEIELLDELYEKQNGQKMSDEQRAFATELFEQIKEEQL